MFEPTHEERWSIWLLFHCANHINHASDADVGVDILTNSQNRPYVIEAMGGKVCSVCSGNFEFTLQETALTLYLQYDVDRFRMSSYHVMKDEELLLQE
jgi:hypothetical protein